MKHYIFKILLGCASITAASANNPIEIIQTNQNLVVLGKYQHIKEKREIIRNGKVIESSTSNLKDGNIYHFKSKDLVTVFFMDGPSDKGINFNINRKNKTYDLINRKGEAEDDCIILQKNSPDEVIFVRNTEDGDEEGVILVRSTLYLKPVK